VKHLPSADLMLADCQALGLRPGDSWADLFEAYAGELLRWNAKINLVGPAEPARLWRRHFLESLALLAASPPGVTFADIGSGAGFPGLVMGICGRKGLLLEPRRMRYLFLLQVVESLGLGEVTPVHARVEDSDLRGIGLVTARALMPPDRLAGMLKGRAEPGAVLVVRIPPEADPGEGEMVMDPPSPPLDRPGPIAQYRLAR